MHSKSIEPNHSGEKASRWRGIQGGEFIVLNVTVKELILNTFPPTQASGYFAFEVNGAPDWADTERYDISGRLDGERDRPRVRNMMLNLLADRFQAKVHRELREMPVYELSFARTDRKLGPNMTLVEDGVCPKENPCHGFIARAGPGKESGRKVRMDQISGILATWMGRRVIDKTGLTGVFDVSLEKLNIASLGHPDDSLTPGDPESVSIFTAIQEQLGLKVRSAKAQTEVLIVDRVERPSEN
jgi:uncharacterized protein (TIGR03435 family)